MASKNMADFSHAMQVKLASKDSNMASELILKQHLHQKISGNARSKFNFYYGVAKRGDDPSQDRISEIGRSKLTEPYTVSTTGTSGGLNTLSEPLSSIDVRNSLNINTDSLQTIKSRLPSLQR